MGASGPHGGLRGAPGRFGSRLAEGHDMTIMAPDLTVRLERGNSAAEGALSVHDGGRKPATPPSRGEVFSWSGVCRDPGNVKAPASKDDRICPAPIPHLTDSGCFRRFAR